ncbi:hypothetical protein D3C85_1164660 [compost metagenome]
MRICLPVEVQSVDLIIAQLRHRRVVQHGPAFAGVDLEQRALVGGGDGGVLSGAIGRGVGVHGRKRRRIGGCGMRGVRPADGRGDVRRGVSLRLHSGRDIGRGLGRFGGGFRFFRRAHRIGCGVHGVADRRAGGRYVGAIYPRLSTVDLHVAAAQWQQSGFACRTDQQCHAGYGRVAPTVALLQSQILDRELVDGLELAVQQG